MKPQFQATRIYGDHGAASGPWRDCEVVNLGPADIEYRITIEVTAPAILNKGFIILRLRDANEGQDQAEER